MSAFIVSPETITHALSFLRDEATDGKGGQYAWVLGKHAYPTVAGCEIPDTTWVQIATDLWGMNHAAVNWRYSEDHHPDPLTIKWQPGITAGTALKYLHCLRYQCSEGTIPDSPRYKFLQDLCQTIAENLATQNPDYQRAPWGADGHRKEVAA